MSDHSPHFSKSLRIEEAKVEYLPPEILIEIVIRLPIKSILTWTSVSKSWNSLIKNPNFISTHLNHTIRSYNRSQTHLLLFWKIDQSSWDITPIVLRNRFAARARKYIYSLHWDNEAFDEYTRFVSPFPSLRHYRVFRVVGTCNGLVCLSNSIEVFVWNPFIRKYVTLSAPNVTYMIGGGMFDASIGFGFDSKTNDYKVVTVKTLLHKGECPPKVDVYSFATGKWKMVTAVPPTCAVRHHRRQVFVNGSLHWVAFRSKNDGHCSFVLVFDLGDEDFREIMLPKDFLIEGYKLDYVLSVSACGESLALLRRVRGADFCIHVWVMREYGVLESWTKVSTVGPQGPEVELLRTLDLSRLKYAVGFGEGGEVVIEMKDGKLVSIDYESKKIKNVRIPGHGFTFVDPYVESLVLLDKSEGAVSY